jgi:acetyltransferase-like isoleucine patch superfamily enzyme
MNSLAKISFLFIRLWRGLVRRILRIYYKLVLAHLGQGTGITSRVFIEHPYNVYIGSNCNINQFAIIQGSPDGQIRIGDRVTISYGAIILTASLSPNKNFSFNEHENKSVIIQDDVWIAANAMILPGITIGRHAVVGAGAVVTRDVPPYTLVAGVPAKPVRKIEVLK